MLSNLFPSLTRRQAQIAVALLAATICVLAFGALAMAEQAGQAPAEAPTVEVPFFSLNGTLNPGQTISPAFPLANPQRDFNFSLAITGAGTADLTITNGAAAVVWSGAAAGGETVWGTGALTSGVNIFELSNNSGAPVDFDFNLYDLPNTPYLWSGSAAPGGLNSSARVNFPTSGLYTFDFGVNSGGRYDFTLAGDHVQKSIDANAIVAFYVPAGVHELEIVQDTAGGQVDWTVDLAFAGSTSDSLPYAKSGANISEEWLPIFLDSAAQANLETAVSGAAGDFLAIEIIDSTHAPTAAASIFTGETHWLTVDMPAGLSYIHLVANGGYVDYDLVLDALPSTNYTWAGLSDPAGENSQARVVFGADGLYTFDLSAGSGDRYQFLVDVGGESYIQETVEASGSFTSFVPAGTHDLFIDQDTATGADWSVAVSFDGPGNTPLPFAATGGNLGGPGNDFEQEWLPLAMATAGTVNMSIAAGGGTLDALTVEIYQAGSVTPDYTVSQVLGTELLWATFDLSAGANLIRVAAAATNAADMSYELTLDTLPGGGAAAWSGTSISSGLNSGFSIDFPTTALYRFEIDSASGFANLVLDDFIVDGPNVGPTDTSYDIMVGAGTHVIYTVQDLAFGVTDWSASVQPVAAGASFFTFDGTLNPGDTVTPQFPLAAAALDFNFALAVSGGPVAMTMKDGSAATIWSGSATNGETIWGSGTLTSGNNTFAISNTGGGPADVSLVLYTTPSAPFTWTGVTAAGNANSEIRLTFPSSGLYTFDLDVSSGRYQFLINSDYVQKTVETSSSVTYYIPAGTHDLTIDQDSVAGASWSVAVSGPGAANDSLPYNKVGGDIGGLGNDFVEEWLPINLATAGQVNVALALAGTGGNTALLEVYEGPTPVTAILATTVFAGETRWATVDLPAGTSLIRLLAGGNFQPLSYDLDIVTLPSPNTTWSGTAVPVGGNSAARMIFPTAGLYTFNFTAGSGRYQFLLNDDYIQKTVESSGPATFYIPAGTHDLAIVHDSTLGADWGVNVTGPGPAVDSLPFNKSGGDIGGAGNDFTEEWLSVNLGTETEVNLRIDVSGTAGDFLALEVKDLSGSTTLLALDPIFDGERLWATFDLPAGGALINLVADSGNTAPLAYDLTLSNLLTPTAVWDGVSVDTGLASIVRLTTAISGTYLIQVDIPDGFVVIDIDGATAQAGPGPDGFGPDGFYYEFETPLDPGDHTFETVQDPGFPLASWVVTTTLLAADAPQIFSVDPVFAGNLAATPVNLSGFNFMPGVTLALDDGSSAYPLTSVNYLSPEELAALVPAGIPVGIYDLVATNPDGKTAVLADGFEVYQPITGLLAYNSSPTDLGQTTYFTATVATGSDIVYVWDFGDGGSGSGPTASHTYAAPGQYTVTITATNLASNQSATTTVTILLFELYLPVIYYSP